MDHRNNFTKLNHQTLARYMSILGLFVLSIAIPNISIASNVNNSELILNEPSTLEKTVVSFLSVNQLVLMNHYSMKITSLEITSGSAATGFGEVFIPFLKESLPVRFDSIGVNVLGELMYGEVSSITDSSIESLKGLSENDWNEYRWLAKDRSQMPILVSSDLESLGINLGGHDFIITDITLTRESANVEALFLVENIDGSITSFKHANVPIASMGLGLEMCNMQFAMEDEGADPIDHEFPIQILGFNVDNGTGTYVSFDCDGFKEFNIAGEYVFDPNNIFVAETSPRDTVKATFAVTTREWGQFVASVNFSHPFEVDGVDGVIFTVDNVFIDYSEAINIDNFPDDYTSGPDPFWRGFFIKELSIQLPESFSLQGNERTTISATNIIYDNSNGLTAKIGAYGSPHLVEGNLEGWQMSLDTALINITNNSLDNFRLAGDMHIPITGEEDRLHYYAQFIKEGDELKANLNLDVSGTYTIPFLDNSALVLSDNSTIGIAKAYDSKKNKDVYKPFANLNGNFEVSVGDLQFDALGFQGFQIPTSGIKDLSIYAFDFAGLTYVVGDAPDEIEVEEQQPEQADQAENLKGFPISISDITFGDHISNKGESMKKLGFKLAVNFTSEKIGIFAEGGFEVYGKIYPSSLFPFSVSEYKPWEAFKFEGVALKSLLIDVETGGIKLLGSLESFEDDFKYGKGFKAVLDMTVQPSINVQAVAQFGKVGSVRYWFADAKMINRVGVPVIPGVFSIYGFGGGAYYNMVLENGLPDPESLKDYDNQGNSNQTLTTLGVGLSGVKYKPIAPNSGESIGVKATVVLGTFPNADQANMDVTLDMSFNISRTFGLNTVLLKSDVYFMAPITNRDIAKVTAEGNIYYDHTQRLILAGLTTTINATPLTGSGSVGLRFNLNNSSDWYIAIGYPPIDKRMGLQFGINGIGSFGFESYFAMGNLSKLPDGFRDVPKLREYHEDLATFQNNVGTLDPSLANGNSILMGARFGTGKMKEEWFIFRARAEATVGFDLMMSQKFCVINENVSHTEPTNLEPAGINGWYLEGNAYAALSGGIDIYVDLLFYSKWFNVFDISAAAVMEAKLPNPSWVHAMVNGKYSILGGSVKGDFKAEFEFGEKCITLSKPSNPATLLVGLKLIDDIKPDGETLSVREKKIAIITFARPINAILTFPQEDIKGLAFRPILTQNEVSGGIGTWKYFNEEGTEVSKNSQFITCEFESDALLQPTTDYTIEVKVLWQMRTTAEPQWTNVVFGSEQDSTVFSTGRFPDKLLDSDILATYPENGAFYYCIPENPLGGGIALEDDGWGPLFNPRKLIEGKPYDMDYVLRVVDPSTGNKEILFQESMTAVPQFTYDDCLGPQEVSINEEPCQSDDPQLQFIYDYLELKCKVVNVTCTDSDYGRQPANKEATKHISNVGYMDHTWQYGGEDYGSDLAVYYKGITDRAYDTQSNGDYRAIGFPDFSDALIANRAYTLQIVQIPRPKESGYVVNNTTSTTSSGQVRGRDGSGNTTAETIDAPNGETYTITETQREIVGGFNARAPEKIIYEYSFRTSQYDNFVQKLRFAIPKAQTSTFPLLNEFMYNDLVKMHSNIKFGYSQTMLDLISDDPFNSLSSLGVIKMQVELDLDQYEIERLTRHGNFELDGYKGLTLNDVHNFDGNEWTVVPLNMYEYFNKDSKSISKGFPKQEIINSSQLEILDANPTQPEELADQKYYFHKSAPIYTKLNISSNGSRETVMINYAHQIAAWQDLYVLTHSKSCYSYRCNITEYASVSNHDAFDFNTMWQNQHYSYVHRIGGKPAILTYSKPAYGSTRIVWDDLKPLYDEAVWQGEIFAEESGGYTDISGEYYIRAIGSGRYLSNAGGKLSTATQADNNDSKFIFTISPDRGADGLATIKSKNGKSIGVGTMGHLGEIKLLAVPGHNNQNNNYFYSWDGEYSLYENYNTKEIDWASNSQKDLLLSDDNSKYTIFKLETIWEERPIDLTTDYKIRCKGSGHYLYDDQGTLAITSENQDGLAQFRLEPGADGYYEIRSGPKTYYTDRTRSNNYQDWTQEQGIKSVYVDDNGTFKVGYRLSGGNSLLFALEEQDDGSYYIKSKASGKYLYEHFDLDFGPSHQKLLSDAPASNNNYWKFELMSPESHDNSLDLTGQYYIQVKGSGRYLQDDGEAISTKKQADNDALSFVLKRIRNDNNNVYYEIWNKKFKQRMYYHNGHFITNRTDGVSESDYEFAINLRADGSVEMMSPSSDNSSYDRIFVLADPEMGPKHQYLYKEGLNEDLYEDYAQFILSDTLTYVDDLSGAYYIRNNDNRHYLYPNIGHPRGPYFSQQGAGLSKFVLLRREGKDYEIWSNRSDSKKLNILSDGKFSFGGTSTEDRFEFTLDTLDGSYSITSDENSTKIYEHYEPQNESVHKYLRHGEYASHHYANFILEESVEAGEIDADLRGEYHIQVSGSGQYLKALGSGIIKSSSNSSPFFLETSGRNYEIRQANGSRLYAEEVDGKWIYTIGNASGLPAVNYRFKLTKDTNNPDLYTIQSMANLEYLSEHFDLDVNSAIHKQLVSSPSQVGDYGLFELKADYSTPSKNISGKYSIQSITSNRHLHCSSQVDGGELSLISQINDEYLKFVLKRIASGSYEIWSAGNQKRLGAKQDKDNLWTFTTKGRALPDDAYHFTFEENGDNSYSIKNNFSQGFLSEKNALEIENTNQNSNNTHFLLSATQITIDDLTGEGMMAVYANGRYIYVAGNQLLTTTTVDDDRVQFIFEKQSQGLYKIKSKANQRYVHYINGSFSTAQATYNDQDAIFEIEELSNGRYRIKSKESNMLLYEHFDLDLGASHRKILGEVNPTNTDYAEFIMRSSFQDPPQDLSGDYLLRQTSTGRYITASNSLKTKWPVIDEDSLHFILMKQGDDKYGIWSKLDRERIHAQLNQNSITSLISDKYGTSVEPNYYLFKLEIELDGSYKIGYSTENPNQTAYFKVNNGSQIGADLMDPAYFTLENSFDQMPDLSGEYFIKIQGDYRHLMLDPNVLKTSSQLSNITTKPFKLERLSNGSYNIKSKFEQKYLRVINQLGIVVVENLIAGDESFRFYFHKQTDGSYKIQSNFNESILDANYLLERFESSLDPLNGQVINSVGDNEVGINHFVLAEECMQPKFFPDGKEYYIRIKGSGLHLVADGQFLRMINKLDNSATIPFKLEKKQDGIYNVKCQSEEKYLQVNSIGEGSVSIWQKFNNKQLDFSFFEQADGSFKIQNSLNPSFLFAQLDLSVYPPYYHQIAHSTEDNTIGLNHFLLEENYVEPEIIMGNFLLQFSDSRYYINKGNSYINGESKEKLVLGNKNERFNIIPHMSGEYYEIWVNVGGSRQRRVFWEEGVGFSYSSDAVSEEYYQFSIEPTGNEDEYNIKCIGTNEYLSLNNGSIESSEEGQAVNTRIKLTTIYDDSVSKEFLFRVEGSGRYLYIDQDGILKTKIQPDMNACMFRLESSNTGIYTYELWSNNGARAHLNADGVSFSTSIDNSLDDENFLFKIISDGITCVKNDVFLIENYDVFSDKYHHLTTLTNPRNSTDIRTQDYYKINKLMFFEAMNLEPIPPILDANGNEYTSIYIAGKIWLAQNLRTTKYQNGSDIPQEDMFWYNDDVTNYKNSYGALYKRGVIEQYADYGSSIIKSACPVGWRLPLENEIESLLSYSIYSFPSQFQKYHIPYSGIDFLSGILISDNEKRLGGCRSSSNDYMGINSESHFWGAAAYYSDDGWGWKRSYYFLKDSGQGLEPNFYIGKSFPELANSCRCVKN